MAANSECFFSQTVEFADQAADPLGPRLQFLLQLGVFFFEAGFGFSQFLDFHLIQGNGVDGVLNFAFELAEAFNRHSFISRGGGNCP
ncbi:hypothetical protein ElyMa_005540100 [Elysia marginata]|uniref:Uncharacterized protein n=1 Tax=Elysia marginata TaxID=1093978 RepID=A0AAV4EZ12_9GAST|nr:hypothetical protein ElyMa_005540100 [Elysia marginata]